LKQVLISVYSVDFEDHPFTQQQLPACKPILAPQTVIPVLLFVGIVFIPIGLGCIAASNRVVEVVYQYETSCVPGYMIDNKIAYIQNPSIDKTCTRILKVNGYDLKVKKI
jgi:hypothetical protein